MNFDFLNSVSIAPVQVEQKKVGGRVAVERVPTSGASLRLFKDGSIYPSQELVDKYNLEYTKDKSGNGFDVFNSSDWSQYPKDAENVVFISVVPKEKARVDLFGSAREVNGELTSVLSQGSKTFGTELISMLQQTYENSLFQDAKYVDLMIVEDTSLEIPVVFIPKPVVKGVHAGTMTTERRENVVLMPLAIMQTQDIIVGKEVEEPELELV